jgi:uncharacterized protein (DUF1501 family)
MTHSLLRHWRARQVHEHSVATGRTRRDFLCQCCTSLGAAALTFERFGLVNAFAQAPDYRALVCIFLFGGNDSDNMVIPYDDYATYAAVRTPQTAIQIAKDNLLTISPPSAGAQFGLHPRLTGIRDLFENQNLAVVTNVGPLVEPTTRESYRSGTARRPINLFSHSDQQSLWQTSISTALSQTGWGGRIVDHTVGLNPPASPFPMMVTIAGLAVFTTGTSTRALAVSPAPTALNAALRLSGFDDSPASTARHGVMSRLLGIDTSAVLVRSANETMQKALEISAVLDGASDPPVPPFPANNPLADQLRQVAKLIALRNVLNLNRQIFFVSLGGFDLHNGQPSAHATLFSRLSGAMKAFYDATVALGVESQVTTFTLSDFGRTFKPNGGQGTDHAWGAHHIVMGGAVRGGDFYGTYPSIVPDGPDDADAGSGARGRWIPTTAVDQYGATLASWYGVSDADLPAVFPNIGRFASARLGFL